MSWSVRHEGSPTVINGLTVEQIAQGLSEGSWETTDEVRGPADTDWRALENHPQFAELALELEPPPRVEGDDETRLDMNPLIDVCLVLLIFFMLTTSYAAMIKYLDSTQATEDSIKGPPMMTKQKLDEVAIKVDAKVEGDKTVVLVEDKPVEMKELAKTFKSLMHDNAKKTKVWLDLKDNVPYGDYISIVDQAGEAGVGVLLQVATTKPKKK
jgi:biopolymer transport protein ExbD